MKSLYRIGLSRCVAIAVLLFMSGCSDSGSSNPADNNNNGTTLAARWTGTDGIGALFTQRCAPCHITQSLGGYNLSTYDSTMLGGFITTGDPTNSILVQKLEGTAGFGAQMPQGGPYLDAAQMDSIKAWIQAGATPN